MSFVAGNTPLLTFENSLVLINKTVNTLKTFLKEGIPEGKKKLFDNKEYVETYTICYNLCNQQGLHNFSEKLYVYYGETINSYLDEVVVPALKRRTDDKEGLLRHFLENWDKYNILCKWLQKFFLYLDRFYVGFHSVPKLGERAMAAFKEKVFDSAVNDVCMHCLELIRQERYSNAIVGSNAIIAKTVEVFIAVGQDKGNQLLLYTNAFEESFLNESTNYYRTVTNQWIASMSVKEYLIAVEKLFDMESIRCKAYVHVQSELKIQKILDHECIKQKLNIILNGEDGVKNIKILLDSDSMADLSRMFRLLHRLPNDEGVAPMANAFSKYMTEMGEQMVDAHGAATLAAVGVKPTKPGEKVGPDDNAFIRGLIAFHNKYVDIVSTHCSSHPLFQRGLKDAFVSFLNKDVGKLKMADLLSNYVDKLLKSSMEMSGQAENDIESQLEKFTNLFGYLMDKDLFVELYRNQLAKRLLNQKSNSDELEKTMIGKLKLRCGAQFTSKLEGMVNDLAVAKDSQIDYDKHLQGLGVQMLGENPLQLSLLSSGNWPTFKSFDTANIPAEMQAFTRSFNTYYGTKNSERKLTWMYSLGQMNLKAAFGKNVYELQVTTLQAMVLLHFNGLDATPKGFDELVEITGLIDEVLKRVLHSLCSKEDCRILKRIVAKTDEGEQSDAKKDKGIKNSDSFVFNDGFVSKVRRIRIPMASLEDIHSAIGPANSASAALQRKLDEDRALAIEAAIVRIMKIRKQLGHQQLMAEVYSHLSFFRPSAKVIKQRIESLIDREYLAREENNATLYKYLA